MACRTGNVICSRAPPAPVADIVFIARQCNPEWRYSHVPQPEHLTIGCFQLRQAIRKIECDIYTLAILRDGDAGWDLVLPVRRVCSRQTNREAAGDFAVT